MTGIVGAAAVMVSQPMLPGTPPFAAGAMIVVAIEDGIPESQQGKVGGIGTVPGGYRHEDTGCGSGINKSVV
ncbi:hypothetical protein DSCA_28300 [Desulfosarcina alkanivorans]|uniref:Uncharacterized protein n=1 Tax=Desulfosarcina alkanivorans TaxID=571177 RepID=A0A5K7YL44_9BACT|nr:hypothetical protein DSCA_28300 [Desulfosarcina alkanivorans]